jgi:D-glycero-D-manno-heptose 1,7-bisphosphate phosphatase
VIVLLDRDGTIIYDEHYLKDPEKVRLLPGAAEGLRLFQEKGYRLFVISNQSGVGRGLIPTDRFWAVHGEVCRQLSEAQVKIESFLFCFHPPSDECECRKPKTALVPRQWDGLKIPWEKSYVIGDKLCDLELGDNLGAQSLLVLTGYGSTTKKELPNVEKYRSVVSLEEAARSAPSLSKAVLG